MRRSLRPLAVALALILPIAAARAGETDLWQPTSDETGQLARSLDAQWSRLFGSGQLRDRATWNDLAAFALNGLASGDQPERVAVALDALAGLQDSEPASGTYGNVRWYNGDTKVVDRNGVEFTTRHMALAWLLYQDRLTEAQRRPLHRLLDLARTGVERHKVSIAYTNIFLMKAWNLIALGQVFDDPRLGALGRTQLRDWLARARRSGVDEYLSPTYYAVDLENLALIANMAVDAEARALALAGLDIVWGDMALHWYTAGARLGGPHSRDYDRLFNHGGVNEFAARAGWGGQARRPSGPYAAYAYAAPSPAVAALLATPLPRFVSARSGDEPSRRHNAYIGKSLYVGSAEASYSEHDNTLVANLGAGADVPTISAFMDGRRDHYGLIRTLEAGSGHLKALHLKPFIASVQNGPEALYLASAKDNRPDLSALETTVILPADAEYWLDDRPLDLFAATSTWRADPAAEQDKTALTVARAEDGVTELRLDDHADTVGIGVSRRLAVAPGDTLTIAAEIAGGPAALYLNFETADGRLIGAENLKPLRPVATQFGRFDFSATAPDGAVLCKAWLYSSIAGKTALRVRDLTVTRKPAGGASVSEPVAGFDFKPYRADDIPVATGATLLIRRGAAAAALRPLAAWGVDGRPVSFHLVNDGLAFGAVRLTAMHAETRTDGRGTAALWLLGGEDLTDDAAFAAFRAKASAVKTTATRDGDALELRSSGASGPLRVAADVAQGRLIARQGAPDIDPKVAVTVNGTALAR